MTTRDIAADTPRFDLVDRAALVTGAARGLGSAIALALAAAGADVALGVRRGGTAAALIADIESLGRRAVEVPMDIADLDQVQTGVAHAASALGRIDILVNNAGIAPQNPAENVTVDDFEATLAVNVRGTFFTCQHVGRLMLAQGYGRIVTISSQAGLVALPGESVYCMSKAALIELTKCLAVEWGARGVTVNAVAPTFIETPGTEPALSDPHFKADVEERIAGLHRIGKPVDVAGAVVYLCSPAAALVTGHTLVVDGGWTVR